MKVFISSYPALVGLSLGILVAPGQLAAEGLVYSNGFQDDLNGWFVQGGSPVLVTNGTGGISSSDGDSGFARIAATREPHTNWGGYRSVFPEHGYSTSLDIHLDINSGFVNGTRFDYSSAINGTNGIHRRDFVFNVGYYENTSDGTNKRFVITASTGSTDAPGYNPAAGVTPATIVTSGWYRFLHRFENDNGVLKVTLSLVKVDDESVVQTWTISEASDTIGVGGVVGGNRYGWFPVNQFANLPIDRSRLFTPIAITNISRPEPVNYFSLPEALADVAPGETLSLGAGTFTGDYTISKDITLQGAKAGIAAGANPGARGTDETVLEGGLLVSAEGATIDGLVINEGGFESYSPGAPNGVVVNADGVTITNTVISGIQGVQSSGIVTVAGGQDNLTVSNSTLSGNWRGVYLNPGTGNSFTGNLIDGNEMGLGTDGQGDLTVTGNLFSDNTVEAFGASGVGSEVVVSTNAFVNNAVDLAQYSGDGINAEGNFWSNANGPGVKAKGDLDVFPYYKTETDLENLSPYHPPVRVGFSGFDTIQPAVDAALPAGHTEEAWGKVEVDAGSYTENVTVSKDITLSGAKAGVAAGTESVDGSRGTDESELTGGFHVTVPGVTIDGFSITGGTTTPGHVVGVYMTAAADGTVIDNTIVTGITAAGSLGIEGENGVDGFSLLDSRITSNRYGLYLNSGSDAEILRTVFDGNEFGMGTDSVDGLVVSYSEFTDNTTAWENFDSYNLNPSGPVADHNIFTGNTTNIVNAGEPVDGAYNYWGGSAPVGNTGAVSTYPYYTLPDFSDASRVWPVTIAGAPAGDGYLTIQGGITGAVANDTILVKAGTYNEDVALNKSVKLLSLSGVTDTIIKGTKGPGTTKTVHITANNVELAGFTITRDGNNTTDWNGALNNEGISVDGVTGALIRDNLITGNRNGILAYGTDASTIRNNVITDNRTGLHLVQETANLRVEENEITNNWTGGVLFREESPAGGSAPGSVFTNNDISGNWYGQIIDRQTGPGTKDFTRNWLGTAAPRVNTDDFVEPGYAAQVPTSFGGTATAPPEGTYAEVAGTMSANITFSPFLTDGTDTDVETESGRGTYGFQGDQGEQGPITIQGKEGGYATIQAAVDAAVDGDTIEIDPGIYTEEATVNKDVTILGAKAGIAAGPNPGARGSGETVLKGGLLVSAAGVTIDGLVINDGGFESFSPGAPNGVVVDADGVTVTNTIISGIQGSQSSGIVSVAGGQDNLTVSNSTLSGNWRGVYLNPGTGNSFTGNLIDGNEVGIGTDGQGNFSVTGNLFSDNTVEAFGASGVGSGVVASTNAFVNNAVDLAQYSGDEINAEGNFWSNANGPGVKVKGSLDVFPYYQTAADLGNLDPYYPPVRVGFSGFEAIQPAVDAALPAGHTEEAWGKVEVDAGSYTENVTVSKDITLSGAKAGVAAGTEVVDGTRGTDESALTGGFHVTVPGVTIDGFSITGGTTTPGHVVGVYMTASADGTVIDNTIISGITAAGSLGIEGENGVDGFSLLDSRITNNRFGLYLNSGTDAEILRTVFDGNEFGMGTDSVENLLVSENRFEGNGTAWENYDSYGLNPGNQVASYNVFTGNTTDLANAGEPVNGAYNYWGGGAPALNTGVVSTYPYFTGENLDPATLVWPVTIAGAPAGEGYLTIQEGINEAVVNDTINVKAGVYAQNLTVDKEGVKLKGPNAGTGGTAPVRVAEAIILPATHDAGGVLANVTASGVEIDGFVFDGDNLAISGDIQGTNPGTPADINAAIAVSVDASGVNGLKVTNSILRNLASNGVSLYPGSGTPTTGHEVAGNLIHDIGKLGPIVASSGVLVYNNQYAKIEGNTLRNVRAGVQTGNFYLPNPDEAGHPALIASNTIEARARGIFHNLSYGTASSWTISSNTISGVSAGEAKLDGIALFSLSVPATVTDNVITIGSVTQPLTVGYDVWNVKSTTPVQISGGSVSGALNGVLVNNNDSSYGAGADGAHADISGVAITTAAGGTGILVRDAAAGTVALGELSGVSVSGGAVGLAIEGSDASAADAADLVLTGQTGNYIQLTGSPGAVDATGVSFDGLVGSAADLAQNMALEDRIVHKMDDGSLGLVRVKAGELFVTATGSIQRGIDAADSSDMLHVAAGSFNEDLALNKLVHIAGAGATNTIVDGTGTVLAIGPDADGLDAGTPLVISGLTLTGGDTGILVNSVSNLQLLGVSSSANTTYNVDFTGASENIDITGSTFNGGVYGIRLSAGARAANMRIEDSNLDGNGFGFYGGDGSAAEFGANTQLAGLTLVDSSFSNNSNKGIYIESMDDGLFERIEVINSGTGSSAPTATGIDINLKYRAYNNFTLKDSVIEGCGKNFANASGVAVKARNDGSYSGAPATLGGVVRFEGLRIVDNGGLTGGGICLGENSPTATNASPANVVITGCAFIGNPNNAVRNKTSQPVSASYNYWGNEDGPVGQSSNNIFGTVAVSPWYSSEVGEAVPPVLGDLRHLIELTVIDSPFGDANLDYYIAPGMNVRVTPTGSITAGRLELAAGATLFVDGGSLTLGDGSVIAGTFTIFNSFGSWNIQGDTTFTIGSSLALISDIHVKLGKTLTVNGGGELVLDGCVIDSSPGDSGETATTYSIVTEEDGLLTIARSIVTNANIDIQTDAGEVDEFLVSKVYDNQFIGSTVNASADAKVYHNLIGAGTTFGAGPAFDAVDGWGNVTDVNQIRNPFSLEFKQPADETRTLDADGNLFVQSQDTVQMTMAVGALTDATVDGVEALLGYNSARLELGAITASAGWSSNGTENSANPPLGLVDRTLLLAVGGGGSANPGVIAEVGFTALSEGETQNFFRVQTNREFAENGRLLNDTRLTNPVGPVDILPFTTNTGTLVVDDQKPAVVGVASATQVQSGSTVDVLDGSAIAFRSAGSAPVILSFSAVDNGLAGLDLQDMIDEKDVNVVITNGSTIIDEADYTVAAVQDESQVNLTVSVTLPPTADVGAYQIKATVLDRSGVESDELTLGSFCIDQEVLATVELEDYKGIQSGEDFLGGNRAVVFVASGASGILKEWSPKTIAFSNTGIGTAVLDEVPSGTTHISAKTAWNLRRKLPVTLGSNGYALAPFTGTTGKLLGGDINGDNVVNTFDYSILRTNWFTVSDPADITGDGRINGADYDPMSRNFYIRGDLR